MTAASVGAGEAPGDWLAADGTRLAIRPIRPDDAAREQAFVRGLSPDSRQRRFMDAVRELAPAQLARFTRIDPAREVALVALRRVDGQREDEEEVAVARFATDADGVGCEFAIVVADAWQRRGLGRHLMRRLIEAATRRGLRYIWGQVLADNHGMLALARSLGFAVEPVPQEPGLRRVILMLESPGR